MLIVLTTTPTLDEGELLAGKLVDARLAACVQVLPQMTSVYFWEGALQKEPEHLLLIKTLPEKWDELRDFITANHSYEVPEILAIEAAAVADAYREWTRSTISERT